MLRSPFPDDRISLMIAHLFTQKIRLSTLAAKLDKKENHERVRGVLVAVYLYVSSLQVKLQLSFILIDSRVNSLTRTHAHTREQMYRVSWNFLFECLTHRNSRRIGKGKVRDFCHEIVTQVEGDNIGLATKWLRLGYLIG